MFKKTAQLARDGFPYDNHVHDFDDHYGIELFDIQEEVEDVEGRVKNFFRGLFGRGEEPEEEEEKEEDRDNFVEDGAAGGNPFIRDGKLYGQDYEKLKVIQKFICFLK